jgi:hypothetical protein
VTTEQTTEDLGLGVPTDSQAVESPIGSLNDLVQDKPSRDQRRNSDLEYYCRRMRGRVDGQREEKLLIDCRAYAATFLNSESPKMRAELTRRLWDEFIPKHALTLAGVAPAWTFSEFKNAVWHEGFPGPGDPTLAERWAERAEEDTALPSAQKSKPRPRGRRPSTFEIDGRQIKALRGDKTQSELALYAKLSIDSLQRAEAGSASDETMKKLRGYAKKIGRPLTLPKP